jgi:hypothetical protein
MERRLGGRLSTTHDACRCEDQRRNDSFKPSNSRLRPTNRRNYIKHKNLRTQSSLGTKGDLEPTDLRKNDRPASNCAVLSCCFRSYDSTKQWYWNMWTRRIALANTRLETKTEFRTLDGMVTSFGSCQAISQIHRRNQITGRHSVNGECAREKSRERGRRIEVFSDSDRTPGERACDV